MSQCCVWKNLLNWQWSLPENTDGAPETSLIHANETESFQSHLSWVVVKAGVHELVRWNPFRECARMLPHVEIMLRFLSRSRIACFLSGSVHVATVHECSIGSYLGESFCRSRAASFGTSGQTIGIHEFRRCHLECLGNGLTKLEFFHINIMMVVVLCT